MSTELKLRRVTARVFRCPLEQPVMTSFGTMRDRPMVMIEVEDDQGVRGWGEVWCNFPAVGAEHRARLVDSVLTPLLLARSFRDPVDAFEYMTSRTAVLALQSAEPGPFAQAIAGVDTALLYATPLFLCLVLIELADLVFAVDSVPAVFAITQDPFIVYTSNIFAILGLRSLYFALAALMHRFVYLKYALALVLIFIGGKIFAHGFIGKVPALLSLSVTIGLLAGGVILSLLKTRQQPAQR